MIWNPNPPNWLMQIQMFIQIFQLFELMKGKIRDELIFNVCGWG